MHKNIMSLKNIQKAFSSPLLSVVLVAALMVLLGSFFLNDAFFNWAFERHENRLSWWARPFMLLPFALAAWLRSLNGILLAVLALFTSMFWFPQPLTPDPKVVAFLDIERQILQAGWTPINAIGAIAVVIYGVALSSALWRRSILLALGVILLGGVGKALWSLYFSADSFSAVWPVAILGSLIAGGCVFYVLRGKEAPKNM